MKRNTIIEQDLAQIASAQLPWSELEGATILVTGANGFVPAYLVETLLYLNEKRFSHPSKVLALVRNAEKAKTRFSVYEGRPDLELICQDVCQPVEASGSVDFIIHAASQASPKYYAVDPAGTINPNITGTFHLLELARRAHTKSFLFISSGEVYGTFSTPPSGPIDEDHFGSSNPLDLRSCYSEGKRAGEALCKAWQHQYHVPAKVARLAHTYGPGMDLNDGRVFADFVGNIVRGENIVLKSDGSASRPFCYLTDAIVGLFTVLLKGSNGSAYNVLNDEADTRIADLAKMLCGLFPERGLKLEFASQSHNLPAFNQGIILASTRLRALGWRPTTPVKKGFSRTIQYYES